MGSTVTVIACGTVMALTPNPPRAVHADHPLLRLDSCLGIPMPPYVLQSFTEGRHPAGRLILFSPDSSNPCCEVGFR